MKSHFLIKDIALQAGVGPATVDRALNRRGNVRQQTLDRVHQAIIELEKQRKQLAMTGRKLIADFVVEAPQNFLQALDVALAAELPLQRPAVFRIRAAMHTEFPIAAIEQELTRIERRGSDGVIIMAPAAERLVRAINRLEAAGIPVVTFASDSSDSNRTAYVGLDNRVAGGTAAWFLGKWLDHRPAPRVLVTIRNERFRGEEDRETGFRTTLAECLPDAEVEILVEGQHRTTFLDRVTETCAERPFDAVYSIGGGNRGLLDLMDALDRRPGVFIAHDLDPDNRMLLEAGRIDMILSRSPGGYSEHVSDLHGASLFRGDSPAAPERGPAHSGAPDLQAAGRERKFRTFPHPPEARSGRRNAQKHGRFAPTLADF